MYIALVDFYSRARANYACALDNHKDSKYPWPLYPDHNQLWDNHHSPNRRRHMACIPRAADSISWRPLHALFLLWDMDLACNPYSSQQL